jgi:hypothetical protein
VDDQRRDYEDGSTGKTDVPAIGITLQYPLDEGVGRGLVFQTFVAADCRAGELNDALDKVRKAADRQRAIVSLPTFRGLLTDRQDAFKREVSIYYELQLSQDQHNNAASSDSGRRNPKPSAQELQEKAKYEQSLHSSKAKLEQLKQDIVVAERRISDAEALIAAGA